MDKKKLKNFFFKYWFGLLLVLVILLRLPSLFEPFTYGDEGIYLTLGQAAKKGLVFYKDIHDNKPPLLYLVAAVAGTFSRFRATAFIWALLTLYLFYELAFFVFSKKQWPTIISTVIFGVLISIHTFEGNVANAENLMMLPTVGGFFLLLHKKKKKTASLFWLGSGFLFALAALFKVPAAFDFVAALVLLFLITKEKKYRQLASRYLLLITGFITPILLTTAYYANQGALAQYLKAALLQNIPYLASWTPDKAQSLGLPWPLLSRALIVLAVILFLFWQKKKISLATKLTALWFTLGLFGALLSSRPYPHYLLQVVPALALSFGLVFDKTKEKFLPLILTVVLILSFLVFKFWHYPNFDYYQNFYQFALGLKSKPAYFRFFGDNTENLYQLAKYLKTHNHQQERIFIWGTQPSLYALADRLPVGRYAASYHIVDFDGYQETIEALTENPPRYIIVSLEEKHPFPALNAFAQKSYAFEFQLGDFLVFHRILQ